MLLLDAVTVGQDLGFLGWSKRALVTAIRDFNTNQLGTEVGQLRQSQDDRGIHGALDNQRGLRKN